MKTEVFPEEAGKPSDSLREQCVFARGQGWRDRQAWHSFLEQGGLLGGLGLGLRWGCWFLYSILSAEQLRLYQSC